MGYIVAIILGLIEGATEFIPVSSTGHLIIFRQIVGQNDALGLSFDAVLQLATVFALMVYFWKDILNLCITFFRIIFNKNLEEKSKHLLYTIIVATIPAVIFGLILESKMETIFRNAKLVGVTLILGSIIFYFAEKFAKQNKKLSLWRGITIGLFQCLALIPGFSRSGATISGGLFAGLTKDEAVRFSFLLSIPILFGSGLKKLFEVRGEIMNQSFGGPLLVGSIAAFIVGLISIQFLIKYLKTHNLNLFIWYRLVLAGLIFLVF